MERFADELDLAQVLIDDQIELAVLKIRESACLGSGRKECLDCGEEISLSRLQHVPNAKRCPICQEHHESRERLYTKPRHYRVMDELG